MGSNPTPSASVYLGRVAEWLKAHAWKACGLRKEPRGFKSHPVRFRCVGRSDGGDRTERIRGRPLGSLQVATTDLARANVTLCVTLAPGAFAGGGGIRTLKPVRAPVFETGALPFCHPSGKGARSERHAQRYSRSGEIGCCHL